MPGQGRALQGGDPAGHGACPRHRDPARAADDTEGGRSHRPPAARQGEQGHAADGGGHEAVEHHPIVLVADVNERELHGRVLARQLLHQGLDRLGLDVLQRLENVEDQPQRVTRQPAVACLDVLDAAFQRAKQLTRTGSAHAVRVAARAVLAELPDAGLLRCDGEPDQSPSFWIARLAASLRGMLGSTATELAVLEEAELDALRQALADAVGVRAAAAAQPCPDCAVHPALLCPRHAGELDWVSSYRMLAEDLGIELAP